MLQLGRRALMADSYRHAPILAYRAAPFDPHDITVLSNQLAQQLDPGRAEMPAIAALDGHAGFDPREMIDGRFHGRMFYICSYVVTSDSGVRGKSVLAAGPEFTFFPLKIPHKWSGLG